MVNDKNHVNQRYKAIVQFAPDVVYTLSLEGKITSLSSSFKKITGWNNKDWIGKHFSKIVHKEDLPFAMKVFKDTLNKKSTSSYELRIKNNKGEYLVGEFSSAPDVADGEVVGQIGIARDITQHKLDEAENLYYSNIVQSADSAIISRDLSGNITTWNKAAEELFGYKSREIIGKHFSILVPPESKDELEKLNQKIKKGGQVEDYETIRITKSGKRVDVIAKVSPIIDSGRKLIGISAFDRDNTVMKKEREYERYLVRANKILFSSLNFNTTLKRIAKILVPEVADWSAIHIGNDDRLSSLVVAHQDPEQVRKVEEFQRKYESENNKNSISYTVFNSGRSQLYKKVTEDLLKRSVSSREQLGFLKKLNIKSAMVVPMVCGKNIVGVISLVSTNENHLYDKRDLKFAKELGRLAGQAVENASLYKLAQVEISKRKKAQEDLRESRDQLSVILENTADGITLQDESGQLVYANRAAAMVAGYDSPKQMLKNPKKWLNGYEIKTENYENYNLKMLPGRRALRGEQKPEDVLYYVDKKTGEEKWSMVKARPIKDEKGKIRAVVNIVSDVTQRKELERRKNDFISIASHELKTPLTSIKGFTHLLESELVGSSSKGKLYLDKIDSQLERLNELIGDLLDLSRIQSGKLNYKSEVFDLSDVVSEVVDDLRRITKTHSIILRNCISKKVKGDSDRISQVLINLISNAVKYSPKGGEVLVSMKKNKGEVVVSVKDYGIGMHPNEVDKVFDRFYRVKDINDKTFPGLGVGLYISKEIIERHNGTIWADSRKKEGSVFQFALPANSNL